MSADEDGSKDGKDIPELPVDGEGRFDPGNTQIRERVAETGKASIDTLEQALALERAKRQAAEEELANIRKSEGAGLADAKRMLGEARETISVYNTLFEQFGYNTLGAKETPDKIKNALELSGRVAALVGNKTLCTPAIEKLERAVAAAKELDSMGGPGSYVPRATHEDVKAQVVLLTGDVAKLSTQNASYSKVVKTLEEGIKVYTEKIAVIEATQREYVALEAERKERAVKEALRDQEARYRDTHVPKDEYRAAVDASKVAAKERDAAKESLAASERANTELSSKVTLLQAQIDQIMSGLQIGEMDASYMDKLKESVDLLDKGIVSLYANTLAIVSARKDDSSNRAGKE